LANNN